MTRKLPNVKIQLHNRLNSLLTIGESKHQAKKEYKQYCEDNSLKWNPSHTTGIHSISTADNYRQVVNQFGEWMKKEHKEVRTIDQIDKKVAYEYLQSRSHLSAYTISRDLSAINKMLHLDLNKKEAGLKERSYKDITRSRVDVTNDKKYNPANYKDQIEFAKSFGCRRESVLGGDYQVKEISLFKHEEKVYVSLIEKGGRYREAPCLDKYQLKIEEKYQIQERDPCSKDEFIKIYNSSNNDFLFNKYTSKIDNHAFRSEYATNLYKELIENKNNSGEMVKSNYRGYDKESIQLVSYSLGHNRLNVVVENYIR